MFQLLPRFCCKICRKSWLLAKSYIQRVPTVFLDAIFQSQIEIARGFFNVFRPIKRICGVVACFNSFNFGVCVLRVPRRKKSWVERLRTCTYEATAISIYGWKLRPRRVRHLSDIILRTHPTFVAHFRVLFCFDKFDYSFLIIEYVLRYTRTFSVKRFLIFCVFR